MFEFLVEDQTCKVELKFFIGSCFEKADLYFLGNTKSNLVKSSDFFTSQHFN